MRKRKSHSQSIYVSRNESSDISCPCTISSRWDTIERVRRGGCGDTCCHPQTWEVEVGVSQSLLPVWTISWVSEQHGLHSKPMSQCIETLQMSSQCTSWGGRLQKRQVGNCTASMTMPTLACCSWWAWFPRSREEAYSQQHWEIA